MAVDYNKLFTVKNRGEYFDWSTFLITILLFAAGLISIYSATHIYSSTYESELSSTFVRQVISGSIGLVVMILIFFIPKKFLRNYSFLVYLFSIFLLILVLLFGKTIYGTKGWLNIAGFSVQPAEFAKLATLMFLARHLSRKGTDVRNLRDLGIVTGITALPIILILLQPDSGSASVLIVLLLGVLLWTGFDIFALYFIVCLPIIIITSLVSESAMIISLVSISAISLLFRRKILITAAAIMIFIAMSVASPMIYKSLKPHQQDRIATFLNPEQDPRGKGYNVIQSRLAVGSGGLTGKGFLQGTQTQLRYIPKQWTDFIFSVPTEEFGFVGGVAVILLLASLIWKAVSIANMTELTYPSIMAAGIGTIFFYHTLINIGMAIGLMPVMGIPLPFLSAGGSALLVNFMMVGLLLNFFKSRKMTR